MNYMKLEQALSACGVRCVRVCLDVWAAIRWFYAVCMNIASDDRTPNDCSPIH